MKKKFLFPVFFIIFILPASGCYLIGHWGEEYSSSSSKSSVSSSSSSSSVSSPKTITSFGFTSALNSGAGINNDVVGVISGTNISLTVPYGSVVKALKATFSITGVKIQVGAADQKSGETANDFTSPVVYTVTAADGSTGNYTVTVTIAPMTAKEMTVFGFTSVLNSGAGINNDIAGVISGNNISLTVPYGTVLTALKATFSITGVKVQVGSAVQTSGVTANNFTSPVVYTVTASDGSTKNYTVTLTMSPITAREITTFGFTGALNSAALINSDTACTINEPSKAITLTVPFYTVLTGLKATYLTTGVNVKIGSTLQTSGVTANDFTSPVVYTVTAGDSSTKNYTVTITKASLNETGITPSDSQNVNEYFGCSVSLSQDGKVLAAGAYQKSSQGKVYIYRWNGSAWIETGITASDSATADYFGYSVSLSGDGNTLAVGAYNKNSSQGKAYIYRWNGSVWVETGITASDGSANNIFGISVSLSSDGNTLAVGATRKNSYQGKAYIYKWNSSAWIETGITSSDGAANDTFGSSVSLSQDGNILAVGAGGKTIGGNSAQGKTYIYKWNGSAWIEAGITTSDSAAYDHFGSSVSLSSDGNTLVVGAYQKNSDQGKAYIYRWNGSVWIETPITASDGAGSDEFGFSICLSQDSNTLAVGANWKTIGGNSYQGKAYIYKWNGSAWIETGITSSDGAALDYFGYSVSLSRDGNTLAVGAGGKNGTFGKAYIYK